MTLAPGAVSVIVPLHNGRTLIEACLASIPEEAEIVVVDDCSNDGAADFVEATVPRAVVIRNERNLGFGATSNRGLRAAHGRVRVVLNSDARFRPGALEALVVTFDDRDVGIAGPRLVFPDGTHQTSAASFPSPGGIVAGAFLVNEVYRSVFPHRRFRWEMGLARRDHVIDRDVDWVFGTAIALRDEAFEKTGGFDESFFMYVEETDLCWRARASGWKVRYVAAAVVEHLGGGSSGGDPALHARRLLENEERFMRRAYGERGVRRWRIARLVGSAAKVGLLAIPAVVDHRVRARLRWQWSALMDMLRRRRGS
jgi:GT2 family glycosyltransferase